jgi:outer membrane receptor protein involved in Fe transport
LIATDNVYQLGDDLTKVWGRHNLKFGFQAIDRRFYFPIQASDKGSFAFSPVYTAACPAGNFACQAALNASGLTDSGGNPFASYLLGAAISGLYQANQALYGGHRIYYGAYAQDSFRLSSRLTLNYGLRYDFWSAWFDPRHTVPIYNERTGQLGFVLPELCTQRAFRTRAACCRTRMTI